MFLQASRFGQLAFEHPAVPSTAEHPEMEMYCRGTFVPWLRSIANPQYERPVGYITAHTVPGHAIIVIAYLVLVRVPMAYAVMAYTVMANIVMAYISLVMAYIAMAYIVVARVLASVYSYGLSR